MDYKNESCLVCGRKFEDGDDIVVCPECGTPHHRECWLIDNRCACENLHGTGYEWENKESGNSEAEKAENATNTQHSAETQSTDSNAGGSPFTMPFPPVQDINNESLEAICMSGVKADKNDVLDGIRIGDMAVYIQQSARRYINKFLKGKISFNWAALLFAPAWFFYRKLYKAGAIVLALFVAISLFTAPVRAANTKLEEKITEIMLENGDSDAVDYAAMEKIMSDSENFKLVKEYTKKSTIIIAAEVIPRIIVAFCANEIYRRKIKKDIELVNEATDDSAARSILIVQKGSVSFLWGAVVFIAADYIVPMLISAGNFFTDIF